MGLSTVASGFAAAFWMLIALRIGLAVGEATLTPSSHSLAGDLFPPHQRALAASIYSAAGMAGSATAYIVGAAVLQLANQLPQIGVHLPLSTWRFVLVAVGAPSLLLGLLFGLTVKEPPRGSGGSASRVGDVLRDLRANARGLGGLIAAAGFTQVVCYAYIAWGPELLRRTYGWSIPHAGYAFGLAGLFAGADGVLGRQQPGRREGATDADLPRLRPRRLRPTPARCPVRRSTEARLFRPLLRAGALRHGQAGGMSTDERSDGQGLALSRLRRASGLTAAGLLLQVPLSA